MAIGHLSRLISLQQIPITGQWQGEMPELNGGVHPTIIYRWGFVHCYVWLLKANRCDSNRINLLLHKWQYVWAINSPCTQICPLIIHPGKEFPSFLFLLSSVIVLSVFDCRGNKGFSLPHVTKSFVDLIFPQEPTQSIMTICMSHRQLSGCLNSHYLLENHHAINGKICYKWPFSIANCLFTRGKHCANELFFTLWL